MVPKITINKRRFANETTQTRPLQALQAARHHLRHRLHEDRPARRQQHPGRHHPGLTAHPRPLWSGIVFSLKTVSYSNIRDSLVDAFSPRSVRGFFYSKNNQKDFFSNFVLTLCLKFIYSHHSWLPRLWQTGG